MVKIEISDENIVKLETFIELNDIDCSVDKAANMLIESVIDEWKQHK